MVVSEPLAEIMKGVLLFMGRRDLAERIDNVWIGDLNGFPIIQYQIDGIPTDAERLYIHGAVEGTYVVGAMAGLLPKLNNPVMVPHTAKLIVKPSINDN